MSLKTIFITIPAYEDPLLIPTLESAISNARHPERIRFAIALQYKVRSIPDVSQYTPNLISFDVDTRPSINLVRYELLKFYNDEDYFMMIDSHMTFMKDWDELIINDYARLQSLKQDKVILSKQIPGVHGNMPYSPNEKTLWKFLDADRTAVGYISGNLVGRMEQDVETTEEFFLTNYSSSHFFFTQGRYVKEVGIINAASIRSEEQSMSIRAYLSGWDIYAMNFRNHVGHMDQEYRMAVFGEPYPTYRSKFTYKSDDKETISEIDKLFIDNTGRFSVSNPERSIEDFYKSIGLLDEWQDFCYTYMESLSKHHS